MTRKRRGDPHHDWDDPAGWSKEFHREPALVPVTDALLDTVRAATGRRLLDLACGLGQTTAAAHARGADALGIDLSERRIAAAQERFPDVRFTVGDAARPPTGPWDAIVCRFGAHHLPPSWARTAHEALAPGGRLAIAEWPPRDDQERQNGMKATAHWTKMLEEAGFDDVQVHEVATRFASLSGDAATSEHPPEKDTAPEDRAVSIICGTKGGGV